jgi:predicted exporter
MALEAVAPLAPAHVVVPGWSPRTHRLLALVWLAVTLLVAWHQVQFWRAGRLDNDVLALLPADEQAPRVSQAMRQLAEGASRQIVVMVGAADRAEAQAAARQFDAVWREHDKALATDATGAAGTPGRETLAALQPWRDRLLTDEQRQRLQNTPPAQLAEAALQSLYQPGAAPRLADFASDPLGLWTGWWQAQGAATRARPVDGLTMLEADGLHWVLLQHATASAAFALDGKSPHADALKAAEAEARKLSPQLQVLKAGVPLHAEANAARANWEVNVIGWGSLAAIVLLVWTAFRSPRPVLLVALTLLVGTATALSVTAWLFGTVHLITLIFGASLVGVAEDFGIHWFATRSGHPAPSREALMRSLLPGLALALATSVLAYLVLGIAPFPGLRQMAVFSATGLTAAFLTMLCWFPLLDGGRVRDSRMALAIAGSLRSWPRWRWSKATTVIVAALAVLLLAGGWRLQANDDLRQLQSSPAELMQSQRRVAQLLGLPSPAQFILVQGRDAQQVLQREEALKPLLARLAGEGVVSGHLALSDWVPSLARQQADAALTARVESEVLARVSQALGENLRRPVYDAPALQPATWLQRPEAAPLRALWLPEGGNGAASVVLLQGLQPGSVARLDAALQGLEGVRWVDRTAQISALMARYRVAMSWLLVLGYALVLGALWLRFGRQAWRAWLPTLLATALTLALLGLMGERLQLFNVLALMLLLGIGVDYGIFLLEHRGDGHAWLAVVLGAASTLLSFGLLALSATPALRAFGLTMLFGTGLVWMISPLFRPAEAVS